jgi:hypothetical protein
LIRLLFLFILNFLLPQSANTHWQKLAPGLDYTIIKSNNDSGDGSVINIIRIDPHHWELIFAGVSQPGEESAKTVKQWCESHKLVAAINAGMFAGDYRTHTGYLKYRDHVNNKFANNYQSVMAFDPVRQQDVPVFRIFDLDWTGTSIKTIQNDYDAVIQNLRLIKKPGINVWKQQDRKWSEAAIGEDDHGRILFIFSRSPYTMHDLNEKLLKSGIGIVAAQHLEGGPEAQLYVKAGNFELALCGSFESSYNENDSSTVFWSIPNIIGIKPK